MGGIRINSYSPRRVHEHQHKVARLKRFVNLLQHPPVELRARLVYSGRIDKDDLRRRMNALFRRNFDHANNPVARGLRLGRDNGHLLARKRIQKSALAHVRPAENGNKS